jgi:hypothetical protein
MISNNAILRCIVACDKVRKQGDMTGKIYVGRSLAGKQGGWAGYAG